MIVRSAGDHLLLITQPDHAALAGAVAGAWQREPIAASRRDLVLLAAGAHDNGWREEDEAPVVDPASGRILDFINVPDALKQRVWPRAIGQFGSTPYAAALIAHHALTVYERYRSAPDWQPFFDAIRTARDRALAESAPLSREDLLQDYFFVRVGDLISLMFCNPWLEPQHYAGYELRLDGPRLTITPDPLDGREILLSIAARQLPNRPYRSPADAAAAFAAAPVVTITGVALGWR
jgi:hypothetical protein